MSKLIRKTISIGITLMVALMLMGPVAPAKAVTAAELQAQINTLLATIAELQSQLAALGGEAVTITGVPAGFSFAKALYSGMSDTDVKYLQIVLNSDAATQLAASGVGSAGNETSYFGPLTKAAVVKFQEKYASEILASWGLTAGTGYVGSTTRAKLNSLLTAGVVPGEGEEEEEEEVVTGEGLKVALADDNPVAATIVADSTSGDGAQAMISVLKVKFSNGDSSDVKVTQLDFNRGGISADSDISQAYIYDGDTLVGEYNSFSDAVLQFYNSSGLFTVSAGKSKTITLKVDLANGTLSGKTIRFSVASASAVTSDASAVSGTYPLTGNYMSTATTADLGKLTVATTTGPAAAVDPQEGLEVINFTLAASEQNLEIRRLKFTNIGSTDYTDLTNFKLLDSATQVGNTIAGLESNKTITFDLTSNPITINKGVTKSMHLKADIIGGTNRTFHFTIQEMSDVVVYDTQYGVFLKPNKADSWTVLYAGSDSTVNTGKMTITRNSDSPSGNIALDATNVTLAKFDVKATGEDAKITPMLIEVYGSLANVGLYQGKIYFDGVQKGNTTNLGSNTNAGGGTTTEFTFGNTFIVTKGVTHTLEIKADVKHGTVASPGTSFSGGETLTVKVYSVTAVGRTSMQSVTVSSATGYQLTVAAGTLSAAKNQAYGNWSDNYPTGIVGATDLLLGSFVVSAGASEGANVTGLKVKYATSSNTAIQNMRLYRGDINTGTQIGSAQSTVTGDTAHSFYPTEYISLNQNESFILSVYGDALTSAPTGINGTMTVTEVNGTGRVTNTSVNYTTAKAGQVICLASAGTLGINVDRASSPITDLAIMGDSGFVWGKWKFSASTSAEAIKVTQIVATSSYSSTGVTSTMVYVSLWDGNTQVGTTKVGLTERDASAWFELSASPWVIPAYSEKILTVKSSINLYPLAMTQSSTTVAIATTTWQGAVSGGTNTETSCGAANFMNIYNTKPTVTFVGPSGASLYSGTQTLFEFKVKAHDHAAVKIYRFNFNFIISDNATSTNLYLSTISLYDKADLSTTLNDRVSSSTAANAYNYDTIGKVTIGKGGVLATDNSASTSQAVDVGVFKVGDVEMDEIPAGTEITYVLKGTVGGVGAVNEDEILVELDNWDFITGPATSTSIVWGDQYTTLIPAYYVDTLPAGPSSMTK